MLNMACSVRHTHGAIVGGGCPAIVGNNGSPTGAPWVLVIRIAAQPAVELAVLAQLFAVELDAEAGSAGYANRALFVRHAAAFDNVVHQMVIMRVGCEREVGYHGAQVQ